MKKTGYSRNDCWLWCVLMSRAENTDPWFEAMLRGDFEAAWRVSDSLLHTTQRQDHKRVARHEQNIWDGRPVAGKRVLVRCYHGLGDTIQFIRYAALLKRVAAEVIIWLQPSLFPLLRNVRGIDRVLPLHDGVPDVEYDVDLELNELPYVFRTTLATIPANVPYLHVEPARLPHNKRLKVGLIGNRATGTHLVRFRFISFRDSLSCQTSTGTSCSAIL